MGRFKYSPWEKKVAISPGGTYADHRARGDYGVDHLNYKVNIYPVFDLQWVQHDEVFVNDGLGTRHIVTMVEKDPKTKADTGRIFQVWHVAAKLKVNQKDVYGKDRAVLAVSDKTGASGYHTHSVLKINGKQFNPTKDIEESFAAPAPTPAPVLPTPVPTPVEPEPVSPPPVEESEVTLPAEELKNILIRLIRFIAQIWRR